MNQNMRHRLSHAWNQGIKTGVFLCYSTEFVRARGSFRVAPHSRRDEDSDNDPTDDEHGSIRSLFDFHCPFSTEHLVLSKNLLLVRVEPRNTQTP